MLHSHVAHQLPSIYMHKWVTSPASDNDAELNRHFLFGIDLNMKYCQDLLKLRTKAEKPDIQFLRYAYRK